MPVYLPPDDILAGGWGPVPAELALNPTYTRADVRGGPVLAEIEVSGPQAALLETLDWLRRPVFVYNAGGMSVWWGFVNEVRLSVGASTYTRTLDDMANRIAVAYAAPQPDGSSERRTTGWAEDAASIARYGKKEHLDSFGDAYDAQATARRATLLGRMAAPATRPSPNGGAASKSLLICTGWLETLDWRKYSRIEGRIEFDGAGGGVQPIGWGIVNSNQIGFGDGAIHDAWGRLGGLGANMKLAVTGATTGANNRTWTILDKTGEQVESYGGTAISFEPTDDIIDGAGGMGRFKSDHWVLVSGSTANNRWHRVGAAGADHLRTSVSVSGYIVAEAAGPAIGLFQAQRVSTVEAAAYEAPGTSSVVSLALTGHILAQSFVATTPLTLMQAAIKVGKVGSPADAFRLHIYSDSGGAPGTLLATGELAAAQVADSPAWRWLTLPAVTLAAGTYWIVAARQGSLDAANHFTVGLSSTAFGVCKGWTGSDWVANPTGESLPFRIWGSEDTASQMRKIAADMGQFLAAADMPTATGIVTNPYRDEDETALAAFYKLLDSGTVSGWRLLAQVSPERVLRVAMETGPGDNLPVLGMDGALRLASGGPLPQGWLPVGEWIVLEGLPAAVQAALRVSPVFVEEAEYDWRSGETHINRWSTAAEGRQ